MSSKKRFHSNEEGLKKHNKKDNKKSGFKPHSVTGEPMNNPVYFPKKKK